MSLRSEERAYVVGAIVGLLLKVAILAVLCLGAYRIIASIFETRRLMEELIEAVHANTQRCR